MSDRIAEAHRLCDEAGRPRLEITAYAATPKAEVIEHYERLGIDRMVFLMKIGATESESFAELKTLSTLV